MSLTNIKTTVENGKMMIILTFEFNGEVIERKEEYTEEKMKVFLKFLEKPNKKDTSSDSIPVISNVDNSNKEEIIPIQSKISEIDEIQDVSDLDINYEAFKKKLDLGTKLVIAAIILGATIKFGSMVYNDFSSLPNPILPEETEETNINDFSEFKMR